MQEARVLELAEVLGLEGRRRVRPARLAVDHLREPDRELCDASRVSARGRIARLDRLDARLHEPLEHLADVAVEDRGLQRDARLRGEHAEELLAPFVEGDDLLVHVGPGQQLVARIALLVDELDDADHLVALADERRDEHRSGHVSGAPVEARVEVEGRPRGQVVHIGNAQGRLVERGAAGDRPLAQRHRELARVEGDTLVLGQLEAQDHRPAVARRRLEDVDAARVGAGDEAALLQDDAEELVDVAHGRHRPRDVEQLAELVPVSPQRTSARFGATLRFQELEGAMGGQVEVFAARGAVDDARQALVHRVAESRSRRPPDQHDERRAFGQAVGERGQQLAPSVPDRHRREDDAERILSPAVRGDGYPPEGDEERVRARDGIARQTRVAPELLEGAIHRNDRVARRRPFVRRTQCVRHPRRRLGRRRAHALRSRSRVSYAPMITTALAY